ncbi:MAG: hypothetical protein ACFB6R_17450 [Alphaproteobacteria bacterium]
MTRRGALRPGGIAILALAVPALAGLVACSDKDSDRTSRVKAYMVDVLEPAADGIWEKAGYVITRDGERELWPTTDEGWAAVVARAETIIEAGSVLASDDYAEDRDDWVDISGGLVAAGELVRDTALARDKDALFDAGGHLYRVCRSCHMVYWQEEGSGS